MDRVGYPHTQIISSRCCGVERSNFGSPHSLLLYANETECTHARNFRLDFIQIFLQITSKIYLCAGAHEQTILHMAKDTPITGRHPSLAYKTVPFICSKSLCWHKGVEKVNRVWIIGIPARMPSTFITCGGDLPSIWVTFNWLKQWGLGPPVVLSKRWLHRIKITLERVGNGEDGMIKDDMGLSLVANTDLSLSR